MIPLINEGLATKTRLSRSVVIVIPKEGLTGGAPAILLWYDTDYKT